MVFKNLKQRYRELDKISRIEFIISHAFRLLLVFAIVEEFYLQNWLFLFITVFSLILTFIPAILEKNYNITLPTEFEFVLVFMIFSGFFLGDVKDFYIRYPWWDSFLHFIAGLSLGILGFITVYILYRQKKIKASPVFVAVFTLSFAVTLGTFWEIFEFSMDHYLGTNMQRAHFSIQRIIQYGSTRIILLDTMKDLILDTTGGAIAAISGYLYVKNGDSLLIDTLLKRIYKES
ncbi:MAG: hypothetical protein ACQEQC_08010 [Elusimicrobiota bacterium]